MSVVEWNYVGRVAEADDGAAIGSGVSEGTDAAEVAVAVAGCRTAARTQEAERTSAGETGA